MLDRQTLPLLGEALEVLEAGFQELPGFAPPVDTETLRPVLVEAARRMRDNYPYFHPMYAGQMLKPPHPVARLAYALSLWVNPNNHALDGGPGTSALEVEVVEQLAAMFGLGSPSLGHLTSSGTIANLEALWVARELSGGQAVVHSAGAHYTHARMCGVLGVESRAVATDARGRIDLDAVEAELRRGGVGTVAQGRRAGALTALRRHLVAARG